MTLFLLPVCNFLFFYFLHDTPVVPSFFLSFSVFFRAHPPHTERRPRCVSLFLLLTWTERRKKRQTDGQRRGKKNNALCVGDRGIVVPLVAWIRRSDGSWVAAWDGGFCVSPAVRATRMEHRAEPTRRAGALHDSFRKSRRGKNQDHLWPKTSLPFFIINYCYSYSSSASRTQNSGSSSPPETRYALFRNALCGPSRRRRTFFFKKKLQRKKGDRRKR